MESWSKGEIVEIRAPKATRPWQHVLEPLSGYLNLGQVLYEDSALHGEGFNFGPRAEQNHTVVDLLIDLSVFSSEVILCDTSLCVCSDCEQETAKKLRQKPTINIFLFLIIYCL